MLAPTNIEIIKATVPILKAHGATVTGVFYNNLLRDNPSLQETFNHGNQATGHQTKALAHAVLAYATYIETPEVLASAIKHITHKHASLFIKPEQYAIVGKYLLDAFGEVLGDAFTDEIRNAWLEAYTQLATIMIGAEAALYQQSNGWTDWRDFVIESKTCESSEITSFTFRPKDGNKLPTYLPGQYVSVRIHVPSLGYTQTRQYSLSDSYNGDSYRISVKKEPGVSVNDPTHPGLVSNALHETTQVGDVVQLSHPMGDFTLEQDPKANSPLVLISAGVGVTPMMSMLKTTLADTPSRPITWIQGANSSAKRAFSDKIDEVSRDNENVNVVRFISQPTEGDVHGIHYDHAGRVDLAQCDQKCLYLEVDSSTYFICGPDAFMSSMQAQLQERGVGKSRIQVEKFSTGGF